MNSWRHSLTAQSWTTQNKYTSNFGSRTSVCIRVPAIVVIIVVIINLCTAVDELTTWAVRQREQKVRFSAVLANRINRLISSFIGFAWAAYGGFHWNYCLFLHYPQTHCNSGNAQHISRTYVIVHWTSNGEQLAHRCSVYFCFEQGDDTQQHKN